MAHHRSSTTTQQSRSEMTPRTRLPFLHAGARVRSDDLLAHGPAEDRGGRSQQDELRRREAPICVFNGPASPEKRRHGWA